MALRQKPSRCTLDGYTFSGDFDSGRLGTVRKAADGAFEVSLPSDEGGADAAYRVWYFFSVTGGVAGRTIRLRITNLNVIAKSYNTDLRPFVRVPSLSASWERLEEPATFAINAATLELQLSFQYTFVAAGGASPVLFAFYLPFPYSDCQRLLDNIDRALPSIGGVNARTATTDAAVGATTSASARAAAGSGGAAGGASSMRPAYSAGSVRHATTMVRGVSAASASAVSAMPAATPMAAQNDHSIYYHRELLTMTPDGRRVELLTITSRAGMLSERETYIDAQGLFPKGTAEPRPHKFRGKAGVFVSARVHPGARVWGAAAADGRRCLARAQSQPRRIRLCSCLYPHPLRLQARRHPRTWCTA